MSFATFCLRVLALALTMGQLVMAHVLFDLVAPTLLDTDAQRALAEEMFGKLLEAIPEGARRTRVAVCGRGSGKTTLAAARGLYRMLTADVSMVGVGDVPVVVAVAPDLKTAKVLLRRALELAKATPSIAPYVENEGSDGFTIRRPHDRVLVAFEVFAATAGGRSIRGRSILEALFDEAAFFYDAEYAANVEDLYRAAIGRLMPGGTIWLLSTPWSEQGLFFDLFDKNFGAPKTALVACAPTLMMRDNDPTIAADVAAEMIRDEINAEREFGAKFISAGSSQFFDPNAIDACVDEKMTFPVPHDRFAAKSAGGDFGFESDSSAVVVVQANAQRAWLAFLDEKRPQRGAPLRPSLVVSDFARGLHTYGATRLLVDKHYFQAIKEHADTNRLQLVAAPGGSQGNLETHLATRELINDKKIVLPKHPRFLAQLKSVTSKPLPGGGLKISTPRRRGGGGHGDIASAFVLAAWAMHGSTSGVAERQRFHDKVRTIDMQLALSGNGSNFGFSPQQAAYELRRRGFGTYVDAWDGGGGGGDSLWTRLARAREQENESQQPVEGEHGGH